MSTTALIVLIVLVVVIGALVLWAVSMGRRKRTEQADVLRAHAATQDPDVEQARASAEAAEAQAAQAKVELAQAEAQQENTLRDADRLDPRTDT